jgi:S1-C subfamily serine protease
MTDMKMCCLLVLFVLTAGPVSGGGPADSVVRVYATVRDPELLRPWIRRKPVDLAGSGVVIEGKQVLTNAHHVLYATAVYVQAPGGRKVAARVKGVAPGINLALLTVADERFFDTRPALPRTKKPPTEKSVVKVYGYPAGSDKLAITLSKVFRIDYIAYAAQTSGLQVQIENIVDPCTSGGPVLQGKYMMGLALNLGTRDPIGHIIPNEEIEAFLEDMADGRYDGKPWLHLPLQNLQNETLRKRLRLRAATEGLLVTRSSGPLQKLDIITKIGGYFLDNEGQVRVDDLRLPFQYLIPRVAKQGKVRAGVLRNGEPMNIDLPVTRGSEFLIRDLGGELPPYYLFGPLVFSSVSIESAEQLLQLNADPSSPVVQRQNDKIRFPGEELVVVTTVLPHKCLAGYQNPLGRVIRAVNDIEIKNLRHLAEVLDNSSAEFVTLEWAGGQSEFVVLQRDEMRRVTREIMKKNDIPSRASRN